jgi:integrase
MLQKIPFTTVAKNCRHSTVAKERLSPAILRGRGVTNHGVHFQRPGSSNWWIKLRSPTGRIEKSLGTPDRREAEVAAGELITQHKAALLAARPRVEMVWRPEYEPGLHIGLNGEHIYATEREVHYLDESPIRIETNGVLVRRLIARGKLPAKVEFGMLDDAHAERPVLAKKNGDDELLEMYLRHANISERFEREARDTWAIYKQLTNSKPLAKATRDDGRSLVQYFKDKGNKSATVVKKIGWLRAACRFAIKEGRLQFNPFAEVVSENSKDELRRKPLGDAEMAVCKKHLGTLSERDQVLFRFLATTGARLGEAFHIDGEQSERGVRYVVIGSKTEASLRRLPLPKDLLPYLPKAIKGPLFSGSPKAASKRLNDFLDECGLKEAAIVVHSLRHRAADRLRSHECPVDIRHALLGHETRSIAESYGEGFAVPLLKKWIDKIGY